MDGGAVMALAAARAAGLEVRAEPGRLVVRGPRRAEPLVQQLLARTGDVLALLAIEDAAVAWRAEVMRPQVPRRGPIPVLVAREVAPAPGCCTSCGEPLEEGRAIRCGACSRAAWLVLHEAREGVGQ